MTTHELARKLLELEDKQIKVWTVSNCDSESITTHTSTFCVENIGSYYCLYPD